MAYTTIDNPTDYFNTVLYTGDMVDGDGTGHTQAITGVGFQPDWIWHKCRSHAQQHIIVDSVRGVSSYNFLNSSGDGAEATTNTNGTISSIDSDGITLENGSDSSAKANNAGASGRTYVFWNWLGGGSASSNTDGDITSSVSVNTTAGFSVGTFTGTGSIATVGTGLTGTQMVILKNRDTTSTNWVVYHDIVDGSYDFMYLNNTNDNSNSSLSHTLGDTFKVGTNNDTNATGDKYVFYAFKSIKGYSKLSTYTGNGNADGAFVYTGFKPAYILIKGTSTTRNWNLVDNKRLGYNVDNDRQYPNLSIADNTADPVDILSNGFKCRGTQTDTNSSGVEYVYYAVAENPFVTSTGIPTTAR